MYTNKANKTKSMTRNLRMIDLFSGCGGMSLGFQNAGFSILAAFDNWKPAVSVYKKNFDHPIYDFDLSSEEGMKFICDLKPDVVIGGPPCQDFSSAGHRNEEKGRADLTVSFAKIVTQAKPEWFVMENVNTIKRSKILGTAIKIFKDAGYGLSMDVLDASYCGVPQSRMRFFMVGHLGSEDNFLSPYFEKNKSKKQMTIHDYLGDSLGVEYYFRIPRSYNRRGVFSIYEPSVTVRGVERPIPKNYKKHPGDLVDVKDKNVRSLTVIERSYLQTFPKSFRFEGTKTDLNQMIGNAVPVKLAEFIANNINEYRKFLAETKTR